MADGRENGLIRAELAGAALLRREPVALRARYDGPAARVVVELSNGCAYAFPAVLVEDLQGASDLALAGVVVNGAGFNLHWPALDVDLYVPALVAGVFGTEKWMARELARRAGQAKSPAKAAAARANGAKGGRPRKTG